MNMIPVTRTRPLVLNVDDDAANRYVKTRSLLLGEMEVIEAETGTAALALIAERQPLLVLLDVNLPDVGGLEVCRRIKADWPDIIVIQISATATTAAEKVIGLESGADCYLTTPVEPMELIAVTRAMLRLRHAEAQAQESSERYRMIVESAVDYAIFTCGLDGRITSWNSGAQAILGLSAGRHHRRALRPYLHGGRHRRGCPQHGDACRFPGISVHAERWHRRCDGSRFWTSGRMVALRDRRGEVAGFLKILYDRSVEKAARDALEALNAELEHRVAERTRDLAEANEKLRAEITERERASEQIRQLQKMEALGQLTGGIAHDFNNLLTAILGGLEVTRRRIEDPRSLRLIDSSINAAQRGAKLIAQLMAFARKQNLQVEYLPLNTLVQDMKELLERSVGAEVRLIYDLTTGRLAGHGGRQPGANGAAQPGDQRARRDAGWRDVATSPAGMCGSTMPRVDLSAGEYADAAIQDNGTGMPEAVQARLFEPFFTTKDVGKGTGLGWPRFMGSSPVAAAAFGCTAWWARGLTFTILLPRAEPENVAAQNC